jgi:hypothetical protein
MANVERIDVVIAAHDNATKVLDNLVNRFGIATKSGLAMGIGFKALDMGVTALMQGFNALTEYISAGVEKNRDFELSMARLESSTNNFDISINGLSDTVKNFSIIFAENINTITSGLQNMIREGFSASESVKLLFDAERLAVVTGDDLATTSHALITVLEIFGLGSESAAYATEKLNQIVGVTGLSIAEVDRILGRSAITIQDNARSLDNASDAFFYLDNKGVSARSMLQEFDKIMKDFNDSTIDTIATTTTLGDRFEKITHTTKFSVDMMNKLKEIYQMDLTGGLDWSGFIDESKVNLVTKALDVLSSKGIDTLKEYNDEIKKTGGFTIDIDWQTFSTGSDDLNKLAQAMLYYNDLVAQSEVDVLTGKIAALTDTLGDLRTVGLLGFKPIVDNLKSLQDLKTQRTELMTLHPLQEDLRYMSMGLEDAAYSSLIHNDATKQLVDSMREQQQVIDDLNRSNQIYTLEENKNSLAIMQIQLSAADHRGRMTRDQKQAIEELQRANMGLRIDTLTNQLVIDQKTLDMGPLQERYNQTKMWYDQEVYTVQNSYGKELDALNAKISLEQKALLDNFDFVKKNNKDIYQNELDTYNARRDLWAQEWINRGHTLPTNYYYYLPSKQTGGYIPETRPYLLHKGESVIPAGGKGGTRLILDKPINVNLTATLYDNVDVQSLVRKLELAIQSGLVEGITTSYG